MACEQTHPRQSRRRASPPRMPAVDRIHENIRKLKAERDSLKEEWRLWQMHHEDEFGLFCDYDDFEQIARAIEQAHGIGAKP